MIVVDSSAFIEFYRPAGNPLVQRAVAEAITGDRVAVNGIIQVEIVSFAPTKADLRRLAGDFQAFRWLELGAGDFELAQDLGFKLRKEGITVPATDLIIAASTLRAGATLYHLDAHFDQIAVHTRLQVRSFL
jgi:predicted nucleic acid-binding protein